MPTREISNINSWFILTELTNDILNQVNALYISLIFKERRKENPNTESINEYVQLSDKCNELSNDSNLFKSRDKMRKTINEYSIILDKLTNA